MNNSKKLLFADETTQADVKYKSPWKVLIADDEPEVHSVTRLVLADYVFAQRKIELFHAYSGSETCEIIRRYPDIALLLLDVVMEEDDSGLSVIECIRNELGNRLVRIILRTGQPGHAPPRKVIMDYDINDYREKTELTATRLFTAVTAALRAYQDLTELEKSRQGLKSILKSSLNLFAQRSYAQFPETVMEHLKEIISDSPEEQPGVSGVAMRLSPEKNTIIKGIGAFEKFVGHSVESLPDDEFKNRILESFTHAKSIIDDRAYIGNFSARTGERNIFCVQTGKQIDQIKKRLIRIFETNINAAYDNIKLFHEIEETQKNLLFMLGEIIETRSGEVGNHVHRVALISRLIAEKAGLGQEESEMLSLASPMHDVGKIAIPDAILNKPSRLTDEEYKIIRTHTLIGYNILRSVHRKLFQSAAIIALQHHERWDGKGYPQGLSGKEIHIFGRITHVADVFDALFRKRIYKSPWDLDRIFDYFIGERGRQFDPELVDLFLDNLDEIVSIVHRFSGAMETVS